MTKKINKILLAWVFQKYCYTFPLSDYFRLQSRLLEFDRIQDFAFSLGRHPVAQVLLTPQFFPREALTRKFETCLSKGIVFIEPSHEYYPKSFLHLNEVPFLLSMKGHPVWNQLDGLSIVGSRDVSELSKKWMEEHINPIIQHFPVYSVSGGARGVDQKAHLISLRNQKPTVAVIPAGLGRLYPHDFKNWTNEIIAQGGALLSEYDYDQEMKRHYFQARNRLIAALGIGTIVVEARSPSGTMITARLARDQGKPVWVMPSHPMDESSKGSMMLLNEGATLICDIHNLKSFVASELTKLILDSAQLGVENHPTH